MRGWSPTADGVRLRHQVVGRRGAPPLLLLQGQANHHGWWDRLLGRFAADRLTITFDYRGTGESAGSQPSAERPWSTASLADDAAQVLDALGVDRADVYATSMGGRVAQELAIRHADRLRHLVLACTSPGGTAAAERSQEVRRALGHPDRDARLRATIDLFYSPAAVAALGGHHAVPRDLFGDPRMSPAAVREHLRVSARHDALDRLSTITAPTLVLHGEDDRMVPSSNAALIAERVPGAQVVTFPGGRHGFFDELEPTVGPLVADFLSS